MRRLPSAAVPPARLGCVPALLLCHLLPTSLMTLMCIALHIPFTMPQACCPVSSRDAGAGQGRCHGEGGGLASSLPHTGGGARGPEEGVGPRTGRLPLFFSP